MSIINGGKIVGAGPSFKCRLFRVLGTFDALFKGVLKTVLVCNADADICLAKISVQPDSDVFII
jgi:hypothetical protein